MTDLLSKIPNPSPHEFTNALIEHCRKLTITTRQFMEGNPEKGLPKDYVLYPGKVDHTTCIAFKVGLRGHQFNNNNNKSDNKKDQCKIAPFSSRWDNEIYDKIEENKEAAKPKPEPQTAKPQAPDFNTKITLKRNQGRNTLRGALKKELSNKKLDDSKQNNWKRMETEDGEIFFFNETTGESVWEDPTMTDLSPGWKVYYDDEGDPYYFNNSTGQTSWTKPEQP